MLYSLSYLRFLLREVLYTGATLTVFIVLFYVLFPSCSVLVVSTCQVIG